MAKKTGLKLGLCCIFRKAPIKFRQTRLSFVEKLKNPLDFLSEIVLHNSLSLIQAIEYCKKHNIGAFRVNSRFCPLITHPKMRYRIEDLKDGEKILKNLAYAKALAKDNHIRLSFHPDQFVILNSPNQTVIARAIEDLAYHADLADKIGADVINIHGGGVYGDKEKALLKLKTTIENLPQNIFAKLTLENDDKSYTPEDLIPLCLELGIPLVYDVHHHRCLKDSLSIEDATMLALATWNREPLFHISSPLEGWDGKKPYRHHDYIDSKDFPSIWLEITPLTVDIEAKAKECAVERLYLELSPTSIHSAHN